MASGVETTNRMRIFAVDWSPSKWRTRLYGTELVRIFIRGDVIHRVWGPDV